MTTGRERTCFICEGRIEPNKFAESLYYTLHLDSTSYSRTSVCESSEIMAFHPECFHAMTGKRYEEHIFKICQKMANTEDNENDSTR